MAKFPCRTPEYRRACRAEQRARETPEQAERRRSKERERNRRRFRQRIVSEARRVALNEAARKRYAARPDVQARRTSSDPFAKERAEVTAIEARERAERPPVGTVEQPAERVVTVGGQTFVTVWYPHKDAPLLVPRDIP
jgi:hypothetical protein